MKSVKSIIISYNYSLFNLTLNIQFTVFKLKHQRVYYLYYYYLSRVIEHMGLSLTSKFSKAISYLISSANLFKINKFQVKTMANGLGAYLTLTFKVTRYYTYETLCHEQDKVLHCDLNRISPSLQN